MDVHRNATIYDNDTLPAGRDKPAPKLRHTALDSFQLMTTATSPTRARPQSALAITLLGTFDAWDQAGASIRFHTAKSRALLAYLAVESGKPHTRSALVGLFWPDTPEDAALRNLSKTLSRLRESLCDASASQPFVLTQRDTLQWNAQAACEIDVDQFARLAQSEDVAELSRATALYRGDFLAGFGLPNSPAFEEWAVLQREHYARLANEALAKLTQAHLAAGEFAPAAAAARRQLAVEPWRESAYRQLMRALSAGGERSEALAQFEACKRTLMRELGVEPEQETIALYERIRAGEPMSALRQAQEAGEQVSSPPSHRRTNPPARPHNLPAQLTSFVGRADVLQAVRDRLTLEDDRLVTLTGLGGVGKTRLALAVAGQLVSEFVDGVWFVPLTGVTLDDASAGTHESLARAVVNALGLTLSGDGGLQSQLFDYLRPRQLLLVLDNFEHVIAGSDFVVALLQAAPGVRVLATSREQLNVAGEFVLPLSGLPIPAAAAADTGGAFDSSCVQLFAERARRIAGDFALNQTNIGHVLHICRAVDGLPLGVELAASWVRHFSLPDIGHAIETNLDFLSAPRRGGVERQHSLRAVFDTSWQLLAPHEKRVLAQLSVFRGAFSREAAMAVSDAKLMTLVALVDKSLLRAPVIGRYELHELVRQFAGERLQHMADAEPGLLDRIAARQSDYVIEFVGTRSEGLYGSSSRQALATITAEADNLSQALHWAMTHGRWEAVDRHLVEILRIYHFQMNYGEGLALAQQLIRHAEDDFQRHPQSVPPHLLSKLIAEQAFLMTFRGTPKEAIASAQAVVVQAHHVGDRESEVAGYLDWGLQKYYLGNLDTAQGILEKALTLARALSQANFAQQTQIGSVEKVDALTRHRALLEAQAMRYLAALRIVQGREDEVQGYEHEIVHAYRQLHHLWGEARTMMFFGDSHFMTWNYPKASDYYERALRIYRDMGNAYGQCHMHIELSRIASFLSNHTAAKQHGEDALRIVQDAGNVRFHAYALATLSDCARRTGDLELALDYAEQAVAIIQTASYPGVFAYCLDRLGDALTRRGQLNEAARAYEQSLALERERGAATLIAVSLVNNARLGMIRDELAQARAYADDAFVLLETHGLSSAPEPWRIYFDLYRVLHAVEDDRAGEMLQKADALVQEQMVRINDDNLRRSFLEQILSQRDSAALSE